MTTDSAAINETATQIAQMAFEDDQNPFALQMYFHYMKEEDVRALLNWTDDMTKWKPKTYPADRGHYRLVAECLLRYYYYKFEPKEEDIECDGEPDYVVGQKFQQEKQYWSKISIDNDVPAIPCAEFEHTVKKPKRKRRPRFFSRDIISTNYK